MDNDVNTRDIAIRCVDALVEKDLLKDAYKYTIGEAEFNVQDIIHNEINKARISEELSEQANNLLNQAIEVITFLEDLSGIGKEGYKYDEDKKYVESFFDKLKKYNLLKERS